MLSRSGDNDGERLINYFHANNYASPTDAFSCQSEISFSRQLVFSMLQGVPQYSRSVCRLDVLNSSLGLSFRIFLLRATQCQGSLQSTGSHHYHGRSKCLYRQEEDISGGFGLGTRNERGEKWI